MDTRSSIHPTIQHNYVQRIVGFLAVSAWSALLLLEEIINPVTMWFIPVTILWPHVARFAFIQRYQSKPREQLCQSIDAVVFALICLTVPNSLVITGLFGASCANALASGGYKLLTKVVCTFVCTALIGFVICKPTQLQILPPLFEIGIALSLVVYFSIFGARSFRSFQKLRMLKQQIERLYHLDPLTKCFNRRYLDERLADELVRSARMNYPLAIVFADIDQFKNLNDEHGHIAGDAILKEFPVITQSCIRKGVDWVARFGGEEFVIVLPGCDGRAAVRVAELIRQKVSTASVDHLGTQLTFTSSFGVMATDLATKRLSSQALLSHADTALYQAKHRGRNCVISFGEFEHGVDKLTA